MIIEILRVFLEADCPVGLGRLLDRNSVPLATGGDTKGDTAISQVRLVWEGTSNNAKLTLDTT